MGAKNDIISVAEEYKYGSLLGFISLLFTTLINLILTPETVSGTPLLIASIASGFVYRRDPSDSRRAGSICGVIGAIPIVIYQSWIIIGELWNSSLLGGPARDPFMMVVLALLGIIVSVPIMYAISVFVGFIGGIIGGWVGRRIESLRS